MSERPSHPTYRVKLADGTPVTVRPIRPDDAQIECDFVRNLSDESRYFRFLDTLRDLTPQMVRHFTDVDQVSHIALIAVVDQDGRETEIGVARCIADPGGRSGEFAIVVADAWQRRGVGRHLMQALAAAARRSNIGVLRGDVLAGNHRMLRFLASLGFRTARHPEDPRLVRAELALEP